MKVGIISDLHGFLPKVPQCDLLLVAGDVTPVSDHDRSFQRSWLETQFTRWLRNASDLCPLGVIGVAGNHDFALEDDAFARSLPWTYLKDEAVQNKSGFKVWGSPWVRPIGRWAFLKDDDQMREVCATIPDDTDIVICHGPPKGYGDRCQNGYLAGSDPLLDRLCEITPALTVVGHIHEAAGVYAAPFGPLVNNSHVDWRYNPVNEVLIINI